MPDLTVLVSGAGTGVGKTWLGSRLGATIATAGIPVTVRKPVQSFDPADDATDADVLGAALGVDPVEVCPRHRWYELAMAPPIAASLLGRPRFGLEELLGELALPPDGVALVEGVGGPRSPLCHDGDTLSLAKRLEPGYVVFVSLAELGVINDVILGAGAFGELPTLVFLNRFDEQSVVHRESLRWLDDRGFDVYTSVQALGARIVSAARKRSR